jgi:hypothetical protein
MPGKAPLKALLARHAVSSMLKQLALQDAIGAARWRVDLQEGSIWFGDGGPHSIQLLGTEGYGDGTWLWAWANDLSDLPPEVIQASVRLRGIGTEENVPELVTGRIPLQEVDGHRLATVACGLLQAGSYYRGPYEGGAAFFLLTDFPARDQVDTSPPRVINAVSTVITTYQLDHRAALAGLADDLHLTLREQAGALTLVAAGGEEIAIQLDGQGRIAKMSATVGPAERTKAPSAK